MADDTADALAARVTRYLHRHIAFLEASIAVLEALDIDDPGAVELCAREQPGRNATAAQLELEQTALLKEWGSGDTASPDARAAVRALAARAEELAFELQQRYEGAAHLAQRAATVVELQANAARRGAGFTRKFGHEPPGAGGLLDRQA